MKNYYYSDGNTKFGPFTLDELKSQKIDAKTLVWCEGMSDWTPVNEIPELKVIFNSTTPPPLPFSAPATKLDSTLSASSEVKPQVVLSKNWIVIILALLIGISGFLFFMNKKQSTPPSTPKEENTDAKHIDTVFIEPKPKTNPSDKKNNVKIVEIDNDENEEEGNDVNHEDIKRDLQKMEESEPLKYVSLTFDVDGTLSGKARIRGRIRNSASLATFKDADLKMTFYAKTGTAIGQQNKVLYEVFHPRSSKGFDWKIEVPSKTQSVNVQIDDVSVY